MSESPLEIRQYPKTLNLGDWIGFECQMGFYSIYYVGESLADKTFTGGGSATTLVLNLPYDHRLNLISIAKEDTSSDDIEVRYNPRGVRDSDYDILYSNSAVTAKSILIELGDAYENLGGAKITFAWTITNAKTVVPRINVQFVEVPA